MAIEETYLIRTEKLVKAYKGRKVVREVEIKVKAGEIVGLLGPNGAGKTTSFYMIVGLVKPTSGKVFFNGKNVTNTPMFKRARMGMGYLSQEPSIFRKMTVQENVMSILETLPMSKKERKQRLDQLLNDLKITKLSKQKAYRFPVASAVVWRLPVRWLRIPISFCWMNRSVEWIRWR